MSDDLVERLRMPMRECTLQHVFRERNEAAARIEAIQAERDDYAARLMAANDTYTEMHLALETAEAERDAIADGMNHTATIAHALEDSAIADNWAWIFEDVLKEMNETLAIRARSKKEPEQ